MSVKLFGRQGENLWDEGVKKPERKEDEEKDIFLLESSQCPACNQAYGVALILPCSHAMCGRCVAAGEGTPSGHFLYRGTGPPVCSVMCPRCRKDVELPCWDWSSAASCLPQHPTLSSGCARQDMSYKEGASDHLQHLQDICCSDGGEEMLQSFLYGSSVVPSTVSPVDGVIDLQEEEMEQSVYGLSFGLDPSSAPPCLHLSKSSLTVTYRGDTPPGSLPDSAIRRSEMTSDPWVMLALPQVCADVVITQGQYYWEVDVCNSSIYRIGVSSLDGSVGWWLERQRSSFFAVCDGSREPLCTVPPQVKSLGVFLNIGGGALSFHNPVTREHLATLPTRFSPAGVLPALGLGQGKLRLRCGLPPPPHIFISKDSTYRGRCGASGVWWRRDAPFRSVRKVIQKFEELAVSDSDSGLVSSFGSSCSTLASNPEMRVPTSVHCGQQVGNRGSNEKSF